MPTPQDQSPDWHDCVDEEFLLQYDESLDPLTQIKLWSAADRRTVEPEGFENPQFPLPGLADVPADVRQRVAALKNQVNTATFRFLLPPTRKDQRDALEALLACCWRAKGNLFAVAADVWPGADGSHNTFLSDLPFVVDEDDVPVDVGLSPDDDDKNNLVKPTQEQIRRLLLTYLQEFDDPAQIIELALAGKFRWTARIVRNRFRDVIRKRARQNHPAPLGRPTFALVVRDKDVNRAQRLLDQKAPQRKQAPRVIEWTPGVETSLAGREAVLTFDSQAVISALLPHVRSLKVIPGLPDLKEKLLIAVRQAEELKHELHPGIVRVLAAGMAGRLEHLLGQDERDTLQALVNAFPLRSKGDVTRAIAKARRVTERQARTLKTRLLTAIEDAADHQLNEIASILFSLST